MYCNNFKNVYISRYAINTKKIIQAKQQEKAS